MFIVFVFPFFQGPSYIEGTPQALRDWRDQRPLPRQDSQIRGRARPVLCRQPRLRHSCAVQTGLSRVFGAKEVGPRFAADSPSNNPVNCGNRVPT